MEITIEYDAAGNRLSVSDTINGAVGATTSYQYDAFDRMTRIATSGPSAAEKRVDLAYDLNSRLTTLAQSSDLAGATLVAVSRYAYDSVGRPAEIAHESAAGDPLQNFTYLYDAASRITQITDGANVANFSYDARDQLVGADHSAANRPDETYEYDAEGNLVRQTHITLGTVREFVWDHRDRLRQVVDRAANTLAVTRTIRFTYDPFNRRTSEHVESEDGGSRTTYFVLDGANVLADWVDEDGPAPAPAVEAIRYLHGPAIDQVLSQESAAGEEIWFTADHLGSIRELIDDAGRVVNQMQYDSFGKMVLQSNTLTTTRFGYAGREYDVDADLLYLRARYYDPNRARFISEDPLGLAVDANTYAYVANNPISHTDPFGLAPFGLNAKTVEKGKWVDAKPRENSPPVDNSGFKDALNRIGRTFADIFGFFTGGFLTFAETVQGVSRQAYGAVCDLPNYESEGGKKIAAALKRAKQANEENGGLQPKPRPTPSPQPAKSPDGYDPDQDPTARE